LGNCECGGGTVRCGGGAVCFLYIVPWRYHSHFAGLSGGVYRLVARCYSRNSNVSNFNAQLLASLLALLLCFFSAQLLTYARPTSTTLHILSNTPSSHHLTKQRTRSPAVRRLHSMTTVIVRGTLRFCAVRSMVSMSS
jgi:hypothetical protein